MSSDSARRTWFEGYRQTYLERDLRDIAAVTHLPEFGRLIALCTGTLLSGPGPAFQWRVPMGYNCVRMQRLAIVFIVALVATLALRSPAHAHEKGGDSPALGPTSFIGYSPCVNGFADVFPCKEVDLLAFLPLSMIGGGTGNDIWGWTDPLTGKEYALMGRSTGTAFVDITNPQQPVYLGNLPTATVESLWRGIKVYQDYAFIVSEAAAHGVQIFDLRTLRSVTNPPRTFVATQYYGSFNTHTLAINQQSGFAYAAGTGTCSGGLHMIDIRSPLIPRFAGCYADDGYTHETQCVNYAGPDSQYAGHEICFNSNEDTLTIVDVTDKAAPRLVSRTGYAGYGYTHQGWLTEDHASFLVDDEIDEINNHHNTRTYVWNVADLDAPRIAGAYTSTSPAIDHNQYVRGTHVFQANYRAGLRVLHIDDAASGRLREVGFFDIYPPDDNPSFNAAWSNYPYFSSGTVVVSGIEQGLFVLRPNLGSPVPSITPTPTSPPSTPTPAAAAVSGRIGYAGSSAPVRDVTVMLSGGSTTSAATDAVGSFAFGTLSPGDWQITPYKSGGTGNAISALDAAYVLQTVVGIRTLGSAQRQACDVTGNGALSSLDAALILQYKVGLIASFPVNSDCGTDWIFFPQPAAVPNQVLTMPALTAPTCVDGAIAYQPITGTAAAQDFAAAVIGDCTGNWQPDPGGGAAATAILAEPSQVRIGHPRRDRFGRSSVPIYVDAGQPFHAVEIQLRHDPNARALRVRRSAAARRATLAFNPSPAGLVRIALASARPLDTHDAPLLWVQLERGSAIAVHRSGAR